MKLARFIFENEISHGIVNGSVITQVQQDFISTPPNKLTLTGVDIPLTKVKLLAPVVPADIFCIGKNYRSHAEEFDSKIPDNPILFIKSGNALNHPDSSIIIPDASHKVDYEAELAVIISRDAKNISRKDALDYVLGYTCANDVSARDCQFSDGQWARAKSFDTFVPLGPWIETDLDPADLAITGVLNGNTMQSSRTSKLIFDIPHLISYLSQSMTLRAGSVLLTGTPEGVGFARKPEVLLKDGDVFEVTVEGIGTLKNQVKVE